MINDWIPRWLTVYNSPAAGQFHRRVDFSMFSCRCRRAPDIGGDIPPNAAGAVNARPSSVPYRDGSKTARARRQPMA
jgi:hypothetical protein